MRRVLALLGIAVALTLQEASGAAGERACRSTWQVDRREDHLRAVDASSPSNAWAAGDTIARWTRGGWATLRGPADPPFAGPFNDIEVVSGEDVWALGDQFVARWDGRRWKRVSTPLYGPNSLLTAMTATDGGLWVFGSAEFGEGNVSWYAARLRGTAWKTWRLPVPRGFGSYGGGLYAADAANSQPWVVGYDDCTASCYRSLAAWYDGRRWLTTTVRTRLDGCDNSRFRSPIEGARSSGFFDVTAATPREVWIGGFRGGCALIVKRNRARWQAMKPTRSGSRVSAIHAVDRTDVWAVADRWIDGLGDTPSFVLRRVDGRWRALRSIRAELVDLVALQTGEMWAVGDLTLHHRCR